MSELIVAHYAQEKYLQDITAAYRRREIREPSIWLAREPDAEEQMLRQSAILQPIVYRQGLIAGEEWNLIPRVDENPAADLAVDVATELIKGIRKFADSRRLLARAFFHGRRYAKIHLERRELTIGDGKPRNWWVPVRLEDQSSNLYRKVIEDASSEHPTAHWERWKIIGDGDFERGRWEVLSRSESLCLISHIYNDEEGGLGYGKGLREALAWIWYTLVHVNQESVHAIERFARGLVHMKLDGLRSAQSGLPNSTLVTNALKTIKEMQARHGLVTDTKDEMEVVSMSGQGHQMLKDFRQELKDDARTLILHASLPTGGGGKAVGSFARAETESESTDAVVSLDQEALAETLDDDLMECIWVNNHRCLEDLGILDEKPRFDLTQDRQEDPNEAATTVATLHGAGVPQSLEDIYKRTGTKNPRKGEAVLEGVAAADPLAGLGGLGGFGAPDRPGLEPLPTDQQTEDHQDTALNGAQVTAAAEIITSVVNNLMPPGTAKMMLVSMFNLDPKVANAMVDEAVAFTPAPQPTAPEPAFGVGVE